MNGQGSDGTGQGQVAKVQLQTASNPGRPSWLKLALSIGVVVVGGCLLGKAINALLAPSRPARRTLPSSRYKRLYLEPSARERLADNRERGAEFEERAGEELAEAFPDKQIASQLTVTTPGGKRRRMDFALIHRNGSVTPIEVKNVSELTERHVQQAEEHRAGLKHTHGVRSGPPIVVVREDTLVHEEHAARVRVMRASSGGGRRRR